MNIEEIKENYSKFTDAKIENIAATKTQSLPKEVIDVLNQEIKKRNLSPNLSADFDSMDQQRKEEAEYEAFNLIHGTNRFYAKNITRVGHFIIGFAIFFMIIPLLGNIIDRFETIIKYGGFLFGTYTLFKYFMNNPTLIETTDNHMIVAQNPIPSSGKISILISAVKFMHSKLNYFKMDYKNIKKVYQKTGMFDDRSVLIVGKDAAGTDFEFPSAIHMLSKDDKEQFFKILETKGIKIDLES